jgi:hypothetical protein
LRKDLRKGYLKIMLENNHCKLRTVTALAAVPALIGALAQLEPSTFAQGCVAARGSGLGSHSVRTLGDGGEILPPETGWQASIGYRWFNSHRHFVGDEEQIEREEEGSQVENFSNFIDLNLTYAFTPRYSASLTVPWVIHTRSQVVRSNDVARTILERFETQSGGIGDVRLEGNGWVLNPEEHQRWNILLGLGFDAPTGEDDARDTFEVFDPATGTIRGERRTVDQSIQPGDGGWGITLDVYSYFSIMPRLNTYVNGAYTFTPEEKNGVPTYRSSPFEAEMSIADAYFGRAGVEYVLWPKYGLSLSLGGRVEGVPAEDAIGGSEGFRRPGYAVSIEPGISVMHSGWSANLYTPVAVYRDRVQSVPDEQRSAQTGTHVQGDAAFADFSVLFSLAKNF